MVQYESSIPHTCFQYFLRGVQYEKILDRYWTKQYWKASSIKQYYLNTGQQKVDSISTVLSSTFFSILDEKNERPVSSSNLGHFNEQFWSVSNSIGPHWPILADTEQSIIILFLDVISIFQFRSVLVQLCPVLASC